MAISRQSIDPLLFNHSKDITRIQRCLRDRKFSATKIEAAKAWHAHSAATHEIQHSANRPTTAGAAYLESDTAAWAPLPDNDTKLFEILQRHLGFKAKASYYAIYFVCYLLAGMALAWVSQFLVFDESIKRVSAQLTSPLIGANFYPAADDPRSEPKISVFAIDDDDLKFFHKTYPLPYSFHAQMLNTMGTLSPAAIFIDIWFHDQRDDPTITELVDAICRLHRDGTHVYLATLSPNGINTATLRPELSAITVPATGPHSLTNKPGACAVEVAVDKAVDVIDRQSWRYDLVSGTPDQRIFSAAAQIYNDLLGHAPVSLSASPLALIWGVKGAEINRRPPGYGSTEDAGCRNIWFKVEAIPMPTALKHKLFASEPDIHKPFCAYHPTLPLSALRKMSGEALQPLIEDHLIVYGGNLQSMDDALYSPVHGRLAGLHMHAMALDNLLHFGPDYPRAEEFDLEKPLSAGTIFPFAVVSVFALLTIFVQWAGSPLPENPTRIPYGLRWTRVKARRLARSCTATARRSRHAASRNRKFFTLVMTLLAGIYSRLKYAVIYLGLPTLLSWSWSWCVRIIITIGMLFLMAWIGLHYFHLGPLSWMEYAISPIAMEFLHVGQKLAHYVHPKWLDLVNVFKKPVTPSL